MSESTISSAYSRVRFTYLAPNALRVTYALPGSAPFPADRPWLKHVLLSQPAVPAGQAELEAEVLEGCVQVRTTEGLVFSEACPPRLGIKRRTPYLSLDIPKLELRLGVKRVDEGVRLAIAIEEGEAFYGWGEWFNAFRRQGGRLRLRIRDAIALLQGRETYSAIPLFLSSRGYAFWLLNSHTSHWHINSQGGVLDIEADGPGADYIFIYGPSFKRTIQTYTALTGRPPLLPRWAFGLWVTSYPQGQQDSVLEHVRQHRQRDIPLDAVILDYHWEQGYHNFQWRRSLFPDPERLIGELKELGVRLGLILTPFLNQRGRPLQKKFLNAIAHNLPPGLEEDDERALAEYVQARAKGYLAHENARWWFGAGGMPDFTNPQAAAWWNNLMRPLIEQGVDFFKNDDGEYLPDDAHSALGMDGGEYHNLYGFFYGKALFEGLADLPRRPLIYARSVWAGSQRYPALFLGDQKPTYEGIRNTLRAGMNLGLLGFAYWTADVFGLDGKTTPEIHMRYAQWALMSPVARYFWRPPDIDDTRFPWSHSPQVEANFRKYTELRYRLLPYYVFLAWQAYQTGLPILRPLVLEFQDDPRLAGIFDQVMLGERLMLCPVVEPGATSRRILLPEGVWHDFWSEQSWQGPGEIDYPAPLDRLPILARGGTVLPMGQVWQYIPDDHSFDHLELHLWPPYPSEGWLYEDDGCTRAYLKGSFTLTRIRTDSDANYLSVRIASAEGYFPERVENRQIVVVIHRCSLPLGVKANGKDIQDWEYEPAASQIVIRLECPTRQDTFVEVLYG